MAEVVRSAISSDAGIDLVTEVLVDANSGGDGGDDDSDCDVDDNFEQVAPGILKELLRSGDRATFPGPGSDCFVHFTCFVRVPPLPWHPGPSHSGGRDVSSPSDPKHDPALKRNTFEFDHRLNGQANGARGGGIDSSRGTTPRTSPSGITILVKNKPFRFTLGSEPRGVIQGWEVAVPTMSLGETATFRFSPDVCYGAAGKGLVVPPNTGLEYDMELVGVDGKYVTGK